MEQAVRHPERFDPREGKGTLIDTEHRARYWWASRLVAGKDVLDAGCGVGYGIEILASAGAATVSGVDIGPAAVEAAERRIGGSAAAIVEGDLEDLPLDDESFDAVVCFEAIEHVEDGGRALAELRRVLKPDGLLLVSSPNPDVYPSGNQHHVHEYRPAGLAAAVGEHFTHVKGYRQHAWLASTIEPDDDDAASPPNGWREAEDARRTVPLEAGGETCWIVAASDRELPAVADVVVLGSPFEAGWWSGEEPGAGSNAGQEAARSAAREAAATERLREAAAALLDANQELAQIPVMKHRMEVLREERDRIREQHDHLSELFAEMQGSTSWRLTAPLRRFGLLRRRRH